VFGIPVENVFISPFIILNDRYEFPSIGSDIREASGYERKIATFFGLKPTGHRDFKAFNFARELAGKYVSLKKRF